MEARKYLQGSLKKSLGRGSPREHQQTAIKLKCLQGLLLRLSGISSEALGDFFRGSHGLLQRLSGTSPEALLDFSRGSRGLLAASEGLLKRLSWTSPEALGDFFRGTSLQALGDFSRGSLGTSQRL
jgi:hypothetical protein